MTLLLALSSLFSRLLGVYRNHELAYVFGATPLSDAYFAAFQVPDTLYRLLVFGAISASFVPLFMSLRRKDPLQGWKFVSSILNGFLLFMLTLCIIVFLFAKPIVALLYPGFSVELQQTTTELLRIMLLSPIFFTFSSLFAGIQNAFRTFWGFALAPIVYNGGIIFGIIVLSDYYGIHGVAYGVVLGAFLHALVQLFPCLRMGFRWQPLFVWDEWFKKLIITGIPRILSLASFQLNFFIEGIIATMLSVGSLTVLRYAQDIQSFPVGIIGVSVAITSFSILTDYAIDEKASELSQHLREKLNHILLLTIPAAVGLYLLRFPIIELILEGGSFGIEAVEVTASVLTYLCIGLVPAAIYPLIARAFFAFHDTWWPFLITLFTVGVNTALALYFSQTMGIAGVGLASAISAALTVLISLVVLRIKYLSKVSFFPFGYFLLFCGASAVMGLAVSATLEHITLSSSWVGLLLQMLVAVAVGVLVYGTTLYLFLRKSLLVLVKKIHH